MPNILNVAQSGLMAAQYGLTTTSHNIANANTPGYSRQVIVQGSATAQDAGFGFIGKGTQIDAVRRIYNEFLGNQVVSSQTSKSQLDTHYSQIKQINNMLADTSAGLSPALQDFFSGVQAASADPNSAATRQTMLSSAQTLASRFQALDGQLSEMRNGVNTQIGASVGVINTYAQQIAKLNDSIEKIMASSADKLPNDLLDQRDQLMMELSKEVQVSVVKQGNSYNVFVGNGQPLVVGVTTTKLVTMQSPTDPSRIQVGYVSNGANTAIPESSLSGGGRLGGLFEFRSQTLDVAQNSLGRVAIGLAETFNAQHRLGQDQKAAMGGDFFRAGAPVVTASTKNTGDGALTATVSNASALTVSDYTVRFDAGTNNYSVTRLSDGAR
ncbi:MAG: putative flagellar hook-associated protein 1 FlgK-like [Paucimonas sp.]|nr:putative flagellar hook-associated protein 1 FlgK-like [Paucimonas sp.]